MDAEARRRSGCRECLRALSGSLRLGVETKALAYGEGPVKTRIVVLFLLALAWAGGYGYGRWYGKGGGAAAPAKAKRRILYWHDPMHPWYKSDKPGVAPDCNMALTPVYEGEEKAAVARPGTIEISPEKQQLIGVQFGTVDYRAATETIRAAAKVTLDETRIAKVQSRIEGWIDHVFADFTGCEVRKGEPLLTVYSPEAYATQQEYLLALRARKEMEQNPIHEMHASTENMLVSARRRLELLDIGEEQIESVAKSGEPIKNLTLYSPISGFVMERNAFLKQRIAADTVLYTLADLSTVWVIADVFEYEAANIRLGMPATMTLAYLPGKTFRGRVSYILPQVDPATRTLKVRIQFDNPGYALKPEMYGDVEFRTGGARKLTVPREAVMNSGLRQVVFVDSGGGTFEARDVKTGAEVGDRVEVLSGLHAGERIVTSGNFLIDSESQLKAAADGMKHD